MLKTLTLLTQKYHLLKEAKLEDNMFKLNINIQENSEKIINGINLLRQEITQ